MMATVTLLARSAAGLSHCKEEDTPEDDLEKAIAAFLVLVDKTVASIAGS